MDFTQAAITAGFRGRRVLSVLLLPLAVGLFRPEGVPDAWVYLWTGNLLNLWWLGALWLLPPTRPLWRHRKPGFMRHAAPVLASLAPAQILCRAALGLLLWSAAPLGGVWSALFCSLAAWGALLMGQAVCLALFVRVRPGRLPAALSLALLAAVALGDLWACIVS